MATGMPPVKYQLITLQGGLDLVTPTLSLPPGVARDAVNFEISITGGYSRIQGYERFDGRPSPSDALYTLITVASSATLAVGNTITNLAATTSGVVIAISGSTVVYTKAVGVFAVSENLYVGGVLKTSVTGSGGSIDADDATSAQYAYLAGEAYRSDIGLVPGSGPIRGVVYIHGADVYAWRNDAAGTAMAIYKSSTSGWTLVSLGYELQFNTGTGEIFEGNTIVGQTSGATAVVTRVAVSSGTWTAGTAAGYINFASVTGNFSAGENIRVGGVTKALAVAVQAAITLNPNGRVDACLDDFGSGIRIYGADGVNYGFEFDGTVYTRIRTGMTTDTPNRVVVHKQHLFFSFGNSVQFSSISDQYNWSPVTGAGEIAAGKSGGSGHFINLL